MKIDLLGNSVPLAHARGTDHHCTATVRARRDLIFQVRFDRLLMRAVLITLQLLYRDREEAARFSISLHLQALPSSRGSTRALLSPELLLQKALNGLDGSRGPP